MELVTYPWHFMQNRHITLYIPGLLGAHAWADPGYFQGLEVAELELLLSRSGCTRHKSAGYESSLFRLFGFSVPEHGLPVAAVTHSIDQGESADGLCLRADPVHLQADRARIVMLGNQNLSVSTEEAGQLAQEFNSLFAEDGLRLEVPVANRWYLKGNSTADIRTHPLLEVIGKDIHDHLPMGKDAIHWHKILNEVQMLFYSSQVNERRRQQGLPEINSIWFWGEGELPQLPQKQWQQVWSNEVISSALAKLSQSDLASLPASADEWLEQSEQCGQHLIVIEALADALQTNDVQRWRDLIEMINEGWLQALMTSLKHNTLSSIRVVTENSEYELTAKGLKRWWKRRRQLMAMQ